MTSIRCDICKKYVDYSNIHLDVYLKTEMEISPFQYKKGSICESCFKIITEWVENNKKI